MQVPQWLKDPRVGFISCYTAVALMQVLALLNPSTTAYDRGFGHEWLAYLISSVFLLGALGALAGQFWVKVPLEYVTLPLLSAGYGVFGLAAIIAAARGEGEGYLLYGLGYFSFGSLFHARWRVRAEAFEKVQREQADAEVERIREASRRRPADTSDDRTFGHDERG